MAIIPYHQYASNECIEEVAIRKVIPLISIVELAHGNIGSKDNII